MKMQMTHGTNGRVIINRKGGLTNNFMMEAMEDLWVPALRERGDSPRKDARTWPSDIRQECTPRLCGTLEIYS